MDLEPHMSDVIDRMNEELAEEQDRNQKEEEKLKEEIKKLKEEKARLENIIDDVAEKYDFCVCVDCGLLQNPDFICFHEKCEGCCDEVQCMNERYGEGRW